MGLQKGIDSNLYFEEKCIINDDISDTEIETNIYVKLVTQNHLDSSHCLDFATCSFLTVIKPY